MKILRSFLKLRTLTLCSLLVLCRFVLNSVAQTHPNIYSEMEENVTFHQDSSITNLLQDLVSGAEREMIQIQGYRVQVFSSNRQRTAKDEAFGLEKRIQETDLHTSVYVLYTPPFWKVRLGDFRTQEEAQILKTELLRRLPELQGDTYIVRDQITVSK